MPSEEVLLETIKFKEEKDKIFIFPHKHKINKYPFIVTFFPINCKISVSIDDRSIIPVDNLFQDEITAEKQEFEKDTFSYLVHVDEVEQTEQICLISISSDEIFESSNIVISEMNPIQITLKKEIPEVRYIFPHSKEGGKVLANFIEQNDVLFDVTVEIENERIDTYVCFKNKLITINPTVINEKCTDDYNCNIIFILSIHEDNKEQLNNEIKVEFVAKSQLEIPSILKKNIIRRDVSLN